MQEYTTVDARLNFAEVLNKAAYGNQPIVLTRRGKKLAVVLSVEEYNKLTQE